MSKAKERGGAAAPAKTGPADQPQSEDAPKVEAPADAAEAPAEESTEPTPADAPPSAAPVSAVLDAPPPAAAADADEEEEEPAVSLPTAAAKRLENSPTSRITDEKGNKVNAEDIFEPVDASGEVTCKVRLIEHTVATDHHRPVQVLLVGRGSRLPVQAAEYIKTRVREAAGE